MHIDCLGGKLYGNSYGEKIGELFKYLSGNLAPRVPVNLLGIVAVHCDPDTYPLAPPVHPGVRMAIGVHPCQILNFTRAAEIH